MSSNWPAGTDSLTNPNASDTTTAVDHAAQHTNINDAMEAVQNNLGTNAGTAWAQYMTAGQFPARVTGGGATGTVVQTLVSGSHINTFVGTSQITGGSVASAVLGTPHITGGSMINSFVGTSQITGGTITGATFTALGLSGGTLTSFTIVGTANTITLLDNTNMTNRSRNMFVLARNFSAHTGSPAFTTDTSDNTNAFLLDAAATEVIMSDFVIVPKDFVAGSDIVVKSYWSMVSATSGTVVIDAQYYFVADNEGVAGITGIGNASVVVPGTADTLKIYTHGTVSGLTAGDIMKFRFIRVGGDAGDSATGDLSFYGLELTYTADM